MENILQKIEADKEILATMPKNNKKNITLYIEKVQNLKKEYQEAKDEIFEELEKRYNKIVSTHVNEKIEEEKLRLDQIEELINILTPLNTSYEKMRIDKSIYKLGKFYKENLESVNEEINKIIQKFAKVGTNLKLSDFNYSIYVTEYMKVFFNEMKKGNINSETIKNTFEKIYWKCSDIIIHIELNFRYIYMKNEKHIDKYFEKRKEELLKKYKANLDLIVKKDEELRENIEKKISIDKKLIINKFLDNILNVSDFEDGKIEQEYLKILPEEVISVKEDKNEINNNCIKFLNSLYEYKNYLKFKYIIDDIKNKYNQINEHKNTYNQVKKEIEKKENKIEKLNKKLNTHTLFKNKQEANLLEYNSLIKEIKDLYKKLDEEKIYLQISKNISQNSSIYDVLNFASKYYRYLVECIIEHNKEITKPEIENIIKELKEFAKNPNNLIIKNITILEDKNMQIMISDRYRLLNFNITKEDIAEENLDNIILTLEKIINYINFKESKLNLDDIKFVCEFSKIHKVS